MNRVRQVSEVVVITEVTPSDMYYYISSKDMGFCIPKSKCGDTVPQVGDRAQTICILGSTVVGCILNGVKLYEKSDEEIDADHEKFCKELDDTNKVRYEKYLETKQEKYDSLPDCLKSLIDRFDDEPLEYKAQWEEYQMFALTEAVVIANAFETEEEIEAFHKDGFNEKYKYVGLSNDHSGNTFQGACNYAILIKREQEPRFPITPK